MDRKQKTVLAIFFIFFVGVVGLWNVDLSQGYPMISELRENPDRYVDNEVDTMGVIKNGTLDISTSGISFILQDVEDETFEIEVEYKGALPADLTEGKGISITGMMVSHDRIEANRIVMGCPSKYTE
ncbi:cytochrome c maturation protein CcmE domain-containing protein [Methanolobus halotolerans]|uniref:Cytochrome c biogenesis protein CcmE n=1 Tax=Methanolobus halotolerans TaxID=2052935 RepID=A0A4E0R0R4_9EURY|nr:cytochrome c maturation protein CcmE [Methanolobus halotolerans]TGC10596.1 cytochrome c biogenesis protein CcmE [Methanolobus halotolerans]